MFASISIEENTLILNCYQTSTPGEQSTGARIPEAEIGSCRLLTFSHKLLLLLLVLLRVVVIIVVVDVVDAHFHNLLSQPQQPIDPHPGRTDWRLPASSALRKPQLQTEQDGKQKPTWIQHVLKDQVVL